MGLRVSGELGNECLSILTGTPVQAIVKKTSFDVGVVMQAIYNLEGWK